MLKFVRRLINYMAVLCAVALAYKWVGVSAAVVIAALACGKVLMARRRIRVQAQGGGPLPADLLYQELKPLTITPGNVRGPGYSVTRPRAQHSAPVHLFHIAYSDETLANVPDGAKILRNFTDRSDWREYWPIRHFLLNEPLQEDAYYGFFSPKFNKKTLSSYEKVIQSIHDGPAECDVYMFSPFPDFSAFFLNTFEQQEYKDPGFMVCCEEFFRYAGIDVDLRSLVMDGRQVVFCNYFVAKPRFWRAWFALNEKLFAICEGPDGPLKASMTADTSYAGGVQRKVFVMERTASLLLALDKTWSTWSPNIFRLVTRLPEETVLCQALKLALNQQDLPEYWEMYERTREVSFAPDRLKRLREGVLETPYAAAEIAAPTTRPSSSRPQAAQPVTAPAPKISDTPSAALNPLDIHPKNVRSHGHFIMGPSERRELPVHLFHIAYSEETLANAPAGANILKNFTDRADWREYWPIRNFLLNEPLQEEAYYGFFSPKLNGKTLLAYEDLNYFIHHSPQECDVYLFSPFPEFSAFFLNVFNQQEEYGAPGIIACCEEFYRHAGINVDLRSLVMDARQTVFSNCFAAKPRFWRAWLAINEKLFAICEGPDSPLKSSLTFATSYADGVQRKVFVMERTASLLLALDRTWSTWSLNSFRLLTNVPEEAITCQALKFALREQDTPEYWEMYERTRQAAFAGPWKYLPKESL